MSTYQDNFDKLFASVLENSVLPPICEWLRKNKEVDVSVSELRSAMRLPAAPKSRTSERPVPKSSKTAVASATAALDSEPENGCKWKFERGPSKDKFCGKACYQEQDTVYPLCKTHITTVGGHERLVNEGWDLPQEITLKSRSSGTSSGKKATNSSSRSTKGGAAASRKTSALGPRGKKKEVKSYTIHSYDRKLADKVQQRCGLNANYFAHTFVYPASENGEGDILYYQDPKTKKGVFLYMLNPQDHENPLREPTEQEKEKIQKEGFVLESDGELEEPKKRNSNSSQAESKKTQPEPESKEFYPDPEDDLSEDDDFPDFNEVDEE